MANICLYKIKVTGTKLVCEKLIDMMPLYSWEKEIISENGTNTNYTIIFSGACKNYVDCYTKKSKDLKPYTLEEIKKIQDGDGWDYPLLDKSILLDCDIQCNSKDIDSMCYAYYEHYNKGKQIYDECPKELHIKRGRDYDQYEVLLENKNINEENKEPMDICKVRFIDGYSYWYYGNYEIGDLVYVEGAKSNILGKVTQKAKEGEYSVCYNVTNCVGHITNEFITKDIENIWDSYTVKDRKTFLLSIGLLENTNKKKFLSTMENKWIEFANKEDNWESFLMEVNKKHNL